MKHISTITRAFLLVSVVILVQPQSAWSRDDGQQKANQPRTSSTGTEPLNQELAALRAKVARLETALKKKHKSKAASTNAAPKKDGMKAKTKMSGMKEMKAGKKMGMGMMSAKGKKMGMMSGKKMGMGMMGGKGMGMMGRMPKMAKMSMPSALPGFPGASHLYHIGSTGFFLDHGEHITLSQNQATKLNRQKEKALLKQATLTRKIEGAEQALWVLTSAAEPDATKIEAQVRKIAKFQGDRRIAFIRAVGKAAKVLTDEQRKKLVGQHAEALDSSGKDSNDTPETGSVE